MVGDKLHGIFGPLVFDKKLGSNIGLAGTKAQRQAFADYFSGSFFNELAPNKDLVDYYLRRLDPLGPEAAAFRASQKSTEKSTENALFNRINRNMLRSMTTMLAG